MMKPRRIGAAWLLIAAAIPLLTSAEPVRIDHFEPLAELRVSDDARLSFDAFSRNFDIELQPNHALLGALERHSLGDEVQVYRGKLSSDGNSWARIVIAEGVPRGLVFDGSELYAIEPVDGLPGAGAQPAIFRLADIIIDAGAVQCGSAPPVANAAQLYALVQDDISGTTMEAAGATSQLDVAVIGDFEFTDNKGASAEAELITRMNNVDGIFSAQLGVQINASRIDTYPSNNDPFTNETDAGTLLDELRDYRADTPAQNANGLSHLFTGRVLDGSTAGVAYTGALCNRRFGVGLTQATHSPAVDSLIAAHELGHNFGAPHDGTSGPCESTPQTFLMAPRINNSDTFSDCSINEMQDDIARASCIVAMPTSDVEVGAVSSPGAILLGDSAEVSFDVSSSGTTEAAGVVLDLTVPARFDLDSVTSSVGSCTSGAGTASCALGTLAAGSGATVTLNVTANSVGTGSITARSSATVDDNSGNDDASVALTVDPAVDLVVSAPANGQVEVDSVATLRPTIENRASIAASSVIVSFTPGGDLQFTGGSWSAGSCSASGGNLECSAASLAANSSGTISIQVTGSTVGTQSYSIAVSAAETDRDTSNNEAAGQVSVNAAVVAGENGDGGGGGSTGLLSLLVLLAAARRRRA
jgi:hypothetical protein